MLFVVVTVKFWAQEETVSIFLWVPSPRMGVGRALLHIKPGHLCPSALSLRSLRWLTDLPGSAPPSQAIVRGERSHDGGVEKCETLIYSETRSVTPPVLLGCMAPGFRGGSDCPALLSSQSGGKSNVVSTWPGESQSVRRKEAGGHRHGGGPSSSGRWWPHSPRPEGPHFLACLSPESTGVHPGTAVGLLQ